MEESMYSGVAAAATALERKCACKIAQFKFSILNKIIKARQIRTLLLPCAVVAAAAMESLCMWGDTRECACGAKMLG